MKILLFTSFGGLVPDFVRKFWNETGDKSRFGKIIDKIEDSAIVDLANVTSANLRNNPNAIYCHRRHTEYAPSVNSVTTYIGWCSFSDNITSVDIVDYDETKRYVISRYDGAESLECLDDYVCVDEEHNIWSKSQS